MRRRAAWLLVASLAVALPLLAGCGGPRLVLGPKPAPTGDALQSQVVDELRAWLESLEPHQVETLQQRKQLRLPFPEVQASQPDKAAAIERYVSSLHASVGAQAAAQGTTVPEFTPQEVVVKDLGQGSYQCSIGLGRGTLNLTLSEKQ